MVYTATPSSMALNSYPPIVCGNFGAIELRVHALEQQLYFVFCYKGCLDQLLKPKYV